MQSVIGTLKSTGVNAASMIKVPTPFHVGDVNVYVLGDTFIDTGPKTVDALAVLKTLDITPIKNVLITHGHVDHHGAAFYMKKISNCSVFVHKNDFLAVSDYKDELERKSEYYIQFLEKSGIQKGFISMFNQYYNGFKEYGEGCEVEVLPDTFETEKGVITVIHTPGHTGGSCCFYVDDVLYTGDTLLPTISTNPSIHAVFDDTCGLKNYQKSLKELLPLRVTKCFPGHGGVINDHKKRIQQIFKGHNQRREIVMNSLSERPQSLIEVTEKVFGKVPATETLLALAECFDHLNMLKEEGIVEILERDLYFFKKV